MLLNILSKWQQASDSRVKYVSYVACTVAARLSLRNVRVGGESSQIIASASSSSTVTVHDDTNATSLYVGPTMTELFSLLKRNSSKGASNNGPKICTFAMSFVVASTGL